MADRDRVIELLAQDPEGKLHLRIAILQADLEEQQQANDELARALAEACDTKQDEPVASTETTSADPEDNPDA